jgi:serine/threonine protein kinase
MSDQPPIQASPRLRATSAPPVPAENPQGDTSHPSVIGEYHILDCLGSGGMGTVYRAEQRQPIKRTVAVKVIKPGFDTREVIARFQTERQALARMDHPNVAKVLDAGTDEFGRPFFVMEYVPGVSITTYADENRLSIESRLRLFIQVCNAIAHAHTKAIIHRDIKATNVLVYTHDGKPMVKVIDFGVAKALTGDRLADQTFVTSSGQMIGTYESMSPEQAEARADVDTRTDVYSLGALLYELLSGLPPFDPAMLSRSADLEIRRIIREIDAPRPSARLLQLGDSAANIASARQTRLQPLAGQLRRELEWIPLMAMRKERARRYASPLELARDVENYLNLQPLQAGPDSQLYRVGKFARKRRMPLIMSAIALLLIVALTGWYIRSIREQKKIAEENLDLAVRARDVLIATLQTQDPRRGGRQDTTVSQAMQTLLDRLNRGDLSEQPALKASLLDAIASILINSGQSDRALPLAEQALQLNQQLHSGHDPAIASSMNTLGRLHVSAGQADKALPLLQRSLEMRQRLYGGDNPDVAQSLNNLGSAYESLHQLDRAITYYRSALEMRQRLYKTDHAGIVQALNHLGDAYIAAGQEAQAEELLRQAVAMSRRLYPADHPDLAMSLNNLGRAKLQQGLPADAEPLLSQSVEIYQRLYPGDHVRVAAALQSLGVARLECGNPQQAEPLLEQSVAMWQRLYKNDHPTVVAAMADLAAARAALQSTTTPGATTTPSSAPAP